MLKWSICFYDTLFLSLRSVSRIKKNSPNWSLHRSLHSKNFPFFFLFFVRRVTKVWTIFANIFLWLQCLEACFLDEGKSRETRESTQVGGKCPSKFWRLTCYTPWSRRVLAETKVSPVTVVPSVSSERPELLQARRNLSFEGLPRKFSPL